MDLACHVDQIIIGVCGAIKDQPVGSGVKQERIAKMLDRLQLAKARSVRSLE
jgi:hypothetical protein